MTKRPIFPLLLATLLGAGQAWAASERAEVKVEGATPEVIQSTLSTRLAAGEPFEAKFQGVDLTDQVIKQVAGK